MWVPIFFRHEIRQVSKQFDIYTLCNYYKLTKFKIIFINFNLLNLENKELNNKLDKTQDINTSNFFMSYSLMNNNLISRSNPFNINRKENVWW